MVNASGSVISVNKEQFLKALPPISVNASGKSILAKEVQLAKAEYLIFVTVEGIVILFRKSQLANRLFAIVVVPSANVMFVKLVQPKNGLSPSTLVRLPGRMIEVRLVLRKHLPPNVVNPSFKETEVKLLH